MIEQIQRSGIGPLVRWVQSVLTVPGWILKGSPAPMPPHKKRRYVTSIAKASGAHTFVETGTYRGDTSSALAQVVDHVFTIEIEPTLASVARRRFRRKNVTVLEGNSATLIKQIVDQTSLTGPVLFWLDGHYSAGVTGGKDVDLPIKDELRQILPTLGPRDIVLIDDAREFTGGDYPSLTEIKDWILGLSEGRKILVKNDMIHVYPS